MISEDDAKELYTKMEEKGFKFFKIGPVRFTALINPWEVKRGEKASLLVLLKNNDQRSRRVGVRLDLPKRKRFSSTGLSSEPKEGEYWGVDLPAGGYVGVIFTIFTRSNTPTGDHEIKLSVWLGRARTAAKAAISFASSLVLGKFGGLVADKVAGDEKVISIKMKVI